MNAQEIHIKDLQSLYSAGHEGDIRDDLARACSFSDRLHRNDPPDLDELYIEHPFRVARMAAEWGFERDVILAALLHDIPDRFGTERLQEIEETFGQPVSSLIAQVSTLSDRNYTGPESAPEQNSPPAETQPFGSVSMQALYIKIADRIDVLSTPLKGRESRLVLKAGHTRDVILPMVERAGAYRFVDILEDLCFQIEHPARYNQTVDSFCRLTERNCLKLQDSLKTLSGVFDPEDCYSPNELGAYHRYIIDFQSHDRSYISIYRQLVKSAQNISRDWSALFTKEKMALYDLVLIVSDKLTSEFTLTPEDVFFKYYEAALAKKGFYLLDYRETTHKNSHYFLLADNMENRFRFFVRTEQEYQRFLLGNIMDEENSLNIPDVNENDPRGNNGEKIKVFKKDGAAMFIDKGATVLDFAFAIHTDLGFHFKHATIDESKTPRPAYTVLSAGDTVTIESDEKISPSLSWFKYAKTSRAVNSLVFYFQRLLPEAGSSLRRQ